VVAILALVARKQIQGVQGATTVAVPGMPPASAASGSFAQRASAVPQQVGAEVNQLMQQRPSQLDDGGK
jgi:hypothetical protein